MLSRDKSGTSNDGEGWLLDGEVLPLEEEVLYPVDGDVVAFPLVRDFLCERMWWRSDEPHSSWDAERGNSTGIGVWDWRKLSTIYDAYRFWEWPIASMAAS
jgi:hypothetical protein